jgi:hypothetical protein
MSEDDSASGKAPVSDFVKLSDDDLVRMLVDYATKAAQRLDEVVPDAKRYALQEEQIDTIGQAREYVRVVSDLAVELRRRRSSM